MINSNTFFRQFHWICHAGQRKQRIIDQSKISEQLLLSIDLILINIHMLACDYNLCQAVNNYFHLIQIMISPNTLLLYQKYPQLKQINAYLYNQLERREKQYLNIIQALSNQLYYIKQHVQSLNDVIRGKDYQIMTLKNSTKATLSKNPTSLYIGKMQSLSSKVIQVNIAEKDSNFESKSRLSNCVSIQLQPSPNIIENKRLKKSAELVLQNHKQLTQQLQQIQQNIKSASKKKGLTNIAYRSSDSSVQENLTNFDINSPIDNLTSYSPNVQNNIDSQSNLDGKLGQYSPKIVNLQEIVAKRLLNGKSRTKEQVNEVSQQLLSSNQSNNHSKKNKSKVSREKLSNKDYLLY